MWRLSPRVLLSAFILSLVGLSLAAPGAIAASPSSSPGAASVLRVGMTSGIDNPNIWAVTSVAEWEAVALQYDMLLKFSDKDLTAAPSLATSCDHSADYRVWTCKIRTGVKWSDGQPLTSRDIAFSFKFALDKNVPVFAGYFPGNPKFETPDDQTLIWRTKDPTNAPMVPAWSYVVPEHIWSKYLKSSLAEIKAVNVVPNVASGPYYLTSANPGQNWTFTRNPYFWGQKPAYDSVEFVLYTNQDAMVQALKNGEIAIADGVDSALLPAVSKLANVAVQKVTSDWWVNLAFNFGGQGTSSHPLAALKDLTVRKAIVMAIDKQAIVDKVYYGAGSPGDTIIRPLSAFWHLTVPSDKLIKYDPAGANSLLDAAGYRRGADGIRIDPKNGKPLVIRMPVSDDTAGSLPAGQLIAGYLKAIGITVNVQQVTAGKMSDIESSGNFDAYIWYWSGDPDPNYQLSAFTSAQCGGLSDGCFADPAYDAMFVKQGTIFDPVARQVIVKEMQQYLYDHIPGVALVYPSAIEAYRTDQVAGLTSVPGANGYLVPDYSYTSFVTAHPATASSGAPSSSGLPLWIWAVGALVVVAGGGLVVRRSAKRRDERE